MMFVKQQLSPHNVDAKLTVPAKKIHMIDTGNDSIHSVLYIPFISSHHPELSVHCLTLFIISQVQPLLLDTNIAKD